MLIPWAEVQPGDLLEVDYWGTGDIAQFRIQWGPNWELHAEGARFVRTWGSAPDFAAVPADVDFEVELLQRGRDDVARHPVGWALPRVGAVTAHYFMDAESLCEQVGAYVGIAFPTWPDRVFDATVLHCTICQDCAAARTAA